MRETDFDKVLDEVMKDAENLVDEIVGRAFVMREETKMMRNAIIRSLGLMNIKKEFYCENENSLIIQVEKESFTSFDCDLGTIFVNADNFVVVMRDGKIVIELEITDACDVVEMITEVYDA